MHEFILVSRTLYVELNIASFNKNQFYRMISRQINIGKCLDESMNAILSIVYTAQNRPIKAFAQNLYSTCSNFQPYKVAFHMLHKYQLIAMSFHEKYTNI